MNIELAVNAVEMAIHKLPHMDNLYRQVKHEVEKTVRTRQHLEKDLHNLKDVIESSTQLLNSYYILCERKKQESENPNNELSRIETLVSRCKSDNDIFVSLLREIKELIDQQYEAKHAKEKSKLI